MEEHQQKDEATENVDYTYKFKSDGPSSQLDEFLDSWRHEIYRKRSKNILRLNDYCLYEIFSYLPASDLCAVSETCRDFRRVSHWYFEGHSDGFRLERKYLYDTSLCIANNLCVVNEARENFQSFAHFSFEEHRRSYDMTRKKYFHRDYHSIGITMNDAKRFIRNFGRFLTKLSLKNDQFQYSDKPIRLLPLLDRYCTKLQDLVFDVAFSVPMNITQYERLTWNLHRLTILNYDGLRGLTFYPIDVGSILTHFVSLKHLKMNGVRWIVPEGTDVVKRYEKLEYLSLRNFLLPPIDMFTSFLTENYQFKRVRLTNCGFPETGIEANFTITLPNLESFWLRSRDNEYIVKGRSRTDDIRPLHLTNISGNITALKELLIDLKIFGRSSLNSLLVHLATYKTIENLSILNIQTLSIELVGHLCALTTLKALIFECVEGFNSEIIKQLACELPNLAYVGFHLCDVNFSLIESFLEFSHNLKKIVLFTPMRYRYQSVNYPLTQAIFLSLVNSRLRNKHNNETLSLLVNRETIPYEHVELHTDNNGIAHLLLLFVHVIKVLTR